MEDLISFLNKKKGGRDLQALNYEGLDMEALCLLSTVHTTHLHSPHLHTAAPPFPLPPDMTGHLPAPGLQPGHASCQTQPPWHRHTCHACLFHPPHLTCTLSFCLGQVLMPFSPACPVCHCNPVCATSSACFLHGSTTCLTGLLPQALPYLSKHSLLGGRHAFYLAFHIQTKHNAVADSLP